MIGFLFTLTLRQLTFRKSTLLLAGLAALPVLLAGIFRLSEPDTDPEEWLAQLMNNFVLTGVLPLTAVMLGTSVLGDELEDGTATYLLTKPIARWQIIAPKAAAAFVLTAGFCVLSVVLSGYIALESMPGVVTGYAVGVIAGCVAYTMIFILFSVTTTRALIAGLVYVFLWEGALAGIFEGLRYLAVRHYVLGIAEAISDSPPDVINAYVNGTTAIILLSIVTVVASIFANRRLQRAEVREPS